ncbi:MAG: hypothetical protein WDW38_009795 [Sanguina aurantia]
MDLSLPSPHPSSSHPPQLLRQRSSACLPRVAPPPPPPPPPQKNSPSQQSNDMNLSRHNSAHQQPGFHTLTHSDSLHPGQLQQQHGPAHMHSPLVGGPYDGRMAPMIRTRLPNTTKEGCEEGSSTDESVETPRGRRRRQGLAQARSELDAQGRLRRHRRASSRRSVGMNQPAPLPLVNSLLEAPLPSSGIAWLDAARSENREAFAAGGLPDTRVEAWKYTALRALSQRHFGSGDSDALARSIDPASVALPCVEGPRLVFVNGCFRADLSRVDALPAGLTLQPLSQALVGDAEPLRFALSRHYREAGDAFARINAANAVDGVVLRVAADAVIATPVQLVFVGAAAQADLAWHARNVIELGANATLSLVEQHVGSGEQAHLATLVSDIELHDGAVLDYSIVQNSAPGSSLIRRSSVRLHARSHASLHIVELGGALVRHDLQAELVGDGAELDTRGVFMPHGRQHIDTQLAIRHRALNTRSTSHWRGVASDRARGVFRGAMVVEAGADGSDATLSNKNLLLSPSAEIDTKPELEIYADEVKAAHGATVGQLDERALFYLRSRGIPMAEARSLLTTAFCRAVLDDLPNVALRDHLSGLLIAQLPQS